MKDILEYLKNSDLVKKSHDTFQMIKSNPARDIARELSGLYKQLSENIPKVYKYLYINFADNDDLKKFAMLSSSKLWLTHYKKFNDPLDTYAIQHVIVPEIENNKQYEDKKNQWLDIIHTIFTGCFSLNSPKSIDSILMWSHYARSHKGICIEYNTQDIVNLIKNNCDDSNNPFTFILLPVSYIDSFVSLDGKIGGRGLINIFEKLKPWEYENEWRIISNHSIINLPIQKIYFGVQIPDLHKKIYKDNLNLEMEKMLIKNWCRSFP